MRKLKKVVKVMIFVFLGATVLGFIVMHLWNWLMPSIFGLRTITFWQALGLFVMAKLLLGGFHRHGGSHRWGRHLRARWEQMTPEERERFREGMRGRRACWTPGKEGRRYWEQAAAEEREASHG